MTKTLGCQITECTVATLRCKSSCSQRRIMDKFFERWRKIFEVSALAEFVQFDIHVQARKKQVSKLNAKPLTNIMSIGQLAVLTTISFPTAEVSKQIITAGFKVTESKQEFIVFKKCRSRQLLTVLQLHFNYINLASQMYISKQRVPHTVYPL